MSGAPRSCCSVPTAPARPKSCGGRPSKTCVWRWQERFAEEGLARLLRDKTRPSRIPPLGSEVAERVVALDTCRPAGRDDALDCRHDGQSCQYQRQHGQAHLEGTRAAAAPLAAVQALQRSAIRRQIMRRRRRLCRPAGPCHRAVDRRKKPDPGARSPPSPACR